MTTIEDDGIRHAPNCQRLVIVVTKGYAVTVNRCDECGAVATERHCWPTPSPTTTKDT